MTCHGYVTRYVQRSSRVSHATHTTPHHTVFVVTTPGGVSINESIHRQGSRANSTHARNATVATTHHRHVMDGLREIGGGW